MDKEDLKKSTCINLRCVTQSSKGGVPLSQLQNDYKQLLGTPIPFKDLGYSSLESFLCDIPDVICLKKSPSGSLIAEGVADASTAHIAKLISKQKSKKSKSAPAKPARHVTRTWGSFAKTQSPKLKAPLKDSNSFPPSTTLHGKSEQKSKFLHLTPAQQELKKSVLINLRSVVQSCKDGVPLNRLNKDYKKFIGSNIPFENLGYHSLYEFVQSIPDVIHLKTDVNEQYIAIGVVDKATAHLFSNPVKPKPTKPISPPNEPSKSSVNNRVIFQFSSQQKAETSSFFKLPQNTTELPGLDSVLKYGQSKKKVRKKTQPVYSVSELIKKNKMKNALKEGLIKEEILKAVELGSSCEDNSASEASLSKTYIASLQSQKKIDEKIQNQIKIASLCPLVWMDFLLNGPTKIETLRQKVLSFCGFPFSRDSKEWKEKISLFSQLPKETLHQCLFLLGIEFELKDSRNSLQDKLINFLVNYTEKSGSNVLGTEEENNERELYGSTQTLSSVSSDIYSKCSYFADTETSDAVLSDKIFVIPKTKPKIVSDSDSDFMDLNRLKKSSHRGKGTKEIQVDKRNFNNENCEGIQSGNTCETNHCANAKSPLDKPIFTKQKTAVVQSQKLLDTNSVEQKVEECSKTEISSLSSKNAKKKRKKERKKAENEEKNDLSDTKLIQVCMSKEEIPLEQKSAEQRKDAEECSKTDTSTPINSKSARRKRMKERRKERKKAENEQKNIGLPVIKPV